MALSRAEQRKQAAMMRSATSVGGTTRPPVRRREPPDPGVKLQATPPSDVPDIMAKGSALTGLGSSAAGLAVGLAVGGPAGAILGAAAGAIIGLFGMGATGEAAEKQAGKEEIRAEHIAMANRKAMGQAALERSRGARKQQSAEVAREMATPAQRMMAPQKLGPPGAAETIASTLLGG
jgi:hypothetical protein